MLRLGIVGPPPRPPAEEAKAHRAHRHEKFRDAAAISRHYDVGNDLFCAYWVEPDGGLTAAQYGKFDLMARRLGPASTA